MKFDIKYFQKLEYTKEQIDKYIKNAARDMQIALEDDHPEVKFSYCYQALIKTGIALLSSKKMKVRSVPGHHIKIIEKLAEILEDNNITTMGNLMRSKRNIDLYAGGIEITEKEIAEYTEFVEKALKLAAEKIRTYK